MGTLKKILIFLKDFFTGSLYPGLSVGFMLIVAAAMFYLRPQDFISESAVFPRNPNRPEVQLALRLLKLGAKLALGCAAAIWLILKIELWVAAWRKKRAQAKLETAKEAA